MMPAKLFWIGFDKIGFFLISVLARRLRMSERTLEDHVTLTPERYE